MSNKGIRRRPSSTGIVLSERSFIRQLTSRPNALVALFILVLFVLLASFAPWIAPYPVTETDLLATLQGPTSDHILGTDDLGRDVFTRMIYATRVSLLASGQAVLLAMAVGICLGLVSGYVGGWLDMLIMRLVDAIMVLPGLLLVMGIVGILGAGLTPAMVGLGIGFAPMFVRLTRAEVLAVKERPYIEAARASGISSVRILRKHVTPNIISPLIIQIMMVIGYALLAEGALSYLGLSVQPPTPSWGVVLSRAHSFSAIQPWAVLIPGSAIMLSVWSFNTLGDTLRDLLSAGGERN